MDTSAAATARTKMNITWPSGCAAARGGEHKGEAGRIEHDLEGQQNKNRVPPHDDPGETEHEEDAREDHRMLEGTSAARQRS